MVNDGCLGGSFVISGDRLLREAIAFGSFSLLLRALFRLVSGPLLSRPLSVRSRYIRTTRHHNLLTNSHSCRCERNSHRYRRQEASISADCRPRMTPQSASLTLTCFTVRRSHIVAVRCQTRLGVPSDQVIRGLMWLYVAGPAVAVGYQYGSQLGHLFTLQTNRNAARGGCPRNRVDAGGRAAIVVEKRAFGLTASSLRSPLMGVARAAQSCGRRK